MVQRKANNNVLSLFSKRPEVNVMMTIFCDFRQFSTKKMAFFLNTDVMHQFLQN
jgi:hypothetical protein